MYHRTFHPDYDSVAEINNLAIDNNKDNECKPTTTKPLLTAILYNWLFLHAVYLINKVHFEKN